MLFLIPIHLWRVSLSAEGAGSVCLLSTQWCGTVGLSAAGFGLVCELDRPGELNTHPFQSFSAARQWHPFFCPSVALSDLSLSALHNLVLHACYSLRIKV